MEIPSDPVLTALHLMYMLSVIRSMVNKSMSTDRKEILRLYVCTRRSMYYILHVYAI